MKLKYLQDQRGVAMVLELVLVALVLTLAGVAVYQANHRAKVASSQSSAAGSAAPVANTADAAAASAAAIATQAASSEASISATADSSVSQLNQSSSDTTNLGALSNASF